MNIERYIEGLSREIGLSSDQIKNLFIEAVCKVVKRNGDRLVLPLELEVKVSEDDFSQSNKKPFLSEAGKILSSSCRFSITQIELAQRYQVSISTIRNWIKAGMPNPKNGANEDAIHVWFLENKKTRKFYKRKSRDITIQEFCVKHKISNGSYSAWRNKGMPCLRNGATEKEILSWIHEQKSLSKVKLAERFQVSRQTISVWIAEGMPNPKEGASLNEIDNWYSTNKAGSFSKYEYYSDLFSKFEVKLSSLPRFLEEGMPCLTKGASVQDCEDWIFRNKTSDVSLAKMLNIRPVLVQKYRKFGMPTPSEGATIFEIEDWVNKYHGNFFKIYELEKIMGVCRKTISHFVSKGMADPRTGASIELCMNWEDQHFDEVDEIYKLVRISGKSYDSLVRFVKKGMPDPRDGASANECIKWITARSSLTDLAVKWEVALSTIRNWVILGMPDPREGASEEECKIWFLKNSENLGVKKEPKWGR
jgi:phage terminase Nu1 subunit (DNA packaging protein)